MLVLALGGCLHPQTRADFGHEWRKGWAEWQATDWRDVGHQLTGLTRDDLWPATGAPDEPTEDDRVLCLNQNGEERVVSQNGIEDGVLYRRCPVSPYPTQMGERLSPGHVNPVELNNPLN